ncbi:hypothetical protein CHS0354_041351 [Potamilus streckersoni]|uniref:Glycosyl hydrolase family 59 catalytic domain-containing protein n=1 Tax=Potamilus streckersoni TaxID=2493646 RepID=A0AAE0SF21_9BIVA|nr:hypothetical protein CHS0354_041351 [Potamilus streckersoni]
MSSIPFALISSYYSALQFNRDGLMTASSPWSGYYRVESPIWFTAHTMQFASPKWMHLQKNQGVQLLSAGSSIVSLVNPDSEDLTIILETMVINNFMTVYLYIEPKHQIFFLLK